jgi:hypothetical protein
MNKENLNSKIWYRAIKVIFVLAFIVAEIVGLFYVNVLVSEVDRSSYEALRKINFNPIKMTRAEYQLIYGITPQMGDVRSSLETKYGQQEKSDLTKAVLSGDKISIPNSPISELEFQKLTLNAQKMVDVNVSNRDINSYVNASFSKVNNGEQIQVLKPYEKNLYKNSLLQKICIYLSIPIIILIIFWLFSRVFYYIFLGEKFLYFKLNK